MWISVADAGDHQHHQDRELVDLERGVDLEVADRDPGEIRLHERLRLAGLDHLDEDRHAEGKGQGDHQDADDRGDRPESRTRRRAMLGRVVVDRLHVRVSCGADGSAGPMCTAPNNDSAPLITKPSSGRRGNAQT